MMSSPSAPDGYVQQLERIRGVAANASGLTAELVDANKVFAGVDSTSLADARDTLQLWAEVLTNAHVQQGFAGSPSHVGLVSLANESLVFLESIFANIRSALPHLRRPDLRTWAQELRNALQSNLRDFSKFDFSRISGVEADDFLKFLSEVRTRLHALDEQARLQNLVARASNAVTQTEAAAETAAKAAGKTGDDVMSSFYQALADREGKEARIFRWLTVTLALVAGGFSFMFVIGNGGEVPWLDISGDYVPLVQKVVLVAGIFGLAAYFARQAHQHRSMANWAGSLAVQLQTFDAYLAAIESIEVKDELRKSFAARVFGDHPAMKGEPSLAPAAELGEKALEVATRALGK